ncbi:MAG: T9SS type A sorting domain-containing protein [Bacteroidales bacterium]|nr:T9SS type A sorting domain-containing protein [Bacteroidales bacterium]
MKKYILFFLLALAHTLAVSAQQSTTGEIPPKGIDLIGHVSKNTSDIQAQYLISGVPAYYWRYGCGPTALGMVLGYYDENGFPNIFPGSAATQTPVVQQAISSTEHYNDYSLPLDYYPSLLLDKSEAPAGDEHANNCIADFMETSQSVIGNYYGWSWSSDITSAYTDYLSYATTYQGSAQYHSFSTFSFSSFMSEMDANKPMMALVDTDNDGYTDHFITLIGYKQESGVDYYACYQTWDYTVHYYEYAQIAVGQSWGIYSLYTFDIITSSIDEPEVDLDIYPNPASDILTINSASLIGEDISAKVYNAAGQTMLQSQIQYTGSMQLDVSTLDAGVYMVQIESENNVLNRKFIIE